MPYFDDLTFKKNQFKVKLDDAMGFTRYILCTVIALRNPICDNKEVIALQNVIYIWPCYGTIAAFFQMLIHFLCLAVLGQSAMATIFCSISPKDECSFLRYTNSKLMI